jgi:hypothetical protein
MSVHTLPNADLERSARINRYVAGRMDESEMERFETEMMHSADLQADVEAEILLRDHAQTMAIAHPLSVAAKRGSRAKMALAMAASLMAGWWLNSLMQPYTDYSNRSLALVEISEQRGDAGATTVLAEQPFVARLLTADDTVHQLTLADRNGVTVAQWTALSPAPDGYLTLLFPGLDPGRAPYQVTMSSAAGFEQRLRLVVDTDSSRSP